jgi:hypothetical protein
MEKDFEELKVLFQQKQISATFSEKVVEQKARNYLTTLKINHLQTIILFVITAIALFQIDKITSEKIVTSAYGFWILIGCSLYYAISKTYLLYRLNAIKPTDNVLHTIKQLKNYKKLNTRLLTYGEVLYTIVLTFGVYLYLLPVFKQILLDKTEHTIVYFWWIWTAYICWVLFHALYIKRKRMKKDSQIIENYINDLNK